MEFVANFTLNNDSLDAEFDVSEVENFDALFEIYASGTTWGNISGDIENQTDLYNILSTYEGQIDDNHEEITNISLTMQGYGDIVTYNASDFATAVQGALADTALQPSDLGDGILTIQANGADIGTFSANQSSNETINITIPDSATWGNISGTLSNQTDLQNALNAKQDELTPGTYISISNNTISSTVTIEDLTTQAQYDALNSGADSNNIAQIATNANDISDIQDLIPAQASDSNQLADKDFVNSSVATNTANFIGTFANVPALNAYAGDVTNNDYAFVVNSVIEDNGGDWATFAALDAYDKDLVTNFDYAWVVSGAKFDLYRFDILNQTWDLRVQNTDKADVTLNTAYNRYKAVVENNTVTWEYEYTLNNSSFTASQWAAINSGITSGDVALIQTALQQGDNVSELVNDAGYLTSASLSNYVTLNTAQTISGSKAFSNPLIIADNNGIGSGTILSNKKILQRTSSDNTLTLNNIDNKLRLIGSETRPKYSTDGSNFNDVALYSDLPTVNDGTLTIQVNGSSVGTFTANQSTNTTANIVVPNSATWGNITGDIDDQLDLQDEFDTKQDKLTAGTDLEIIQTAGESRTVSGTNSISLSNAAANALSSVIVYGACSQSGNPTTSNPIDIICNNGAIRYNTSTHEFYADGTTETITDSLNNSATAEMLLAIGDLVDTQNLLGQGGTRKVGLLVLDGTENFNTNTLTNCYSLDSDLGAANFTDRTVYCTHFKHSSTLPNANDRQGYALIGNKNNPNTAFTVGFGATTQFSTVALFKTWLAQQYANGTPVIVVYPLASPTVFGATPQTLTTKAGSNQLIISQSAINNLSIKATYTTDSSSTINFTNDTGYITSASMNSLTDVSISNLANGQGIIYNSTTQKWENQTIQSGGVTDVEVNGESVVTGGVAEIDLSNYQEKLTAGTDLEIVQGATLPSGYTQLTSITSHTEEWINTGVKLTNNFKAVVVGRVTSTPSGNFRTILGANNNNLQTGKQNVILGWATSGWYIEPCTNPSYVYSSLPTDTNTHTFTTTVTSTASSINIDGVVNTVTSAPSITGVNLAIFGRLGVDGTISSLINFELNSIELYQSGVLVFNGVPAKRNADGEVGLYETVSDTFLTNSGTGTFDAGAEVPADTVINFTNDTGYITGIDSTDVTTALGYTPADSSNLATVATTGDYDDLLNKPTIPTVNNGTLTIQKNGTTIDTFTANQSGNTTVNVTVPTNTSELTNNSGFITGIDSSDVTTALGYTPVNPSSLATVATTGDYDDLLNKPTIPTVNDGTLTLTQGGSTLGTFTANQSTNETINVKGLYDYYGLNCKEAGALINNDGIISDFSASNYAYMREPITPPACWEFGFSFTTGTNGGTQYIIGNADTTDNLIKFWIVGNSITWAIGGTNTSSGDTLNSDTEYSARIIRYLNPDYSYRGNYIYLYVYDEDGTLLYNRTLNVASTSKLLQCAFGVTNSSGSFINPFDGSIDLKNVYFDSLLYDAGTDSATATRLWAGAIPLIDIKADVDGSNMVASVKNFDGQWVAVNETIAQSVTVSGSTSDATYNISSLLPSDTYDYECLIWCYAETAATSGKYMLINLYSDIITQYTGVCGGKTSANSAVYCDGNIILPVGTGRTVTVLGQTSSNFAGTYTLKLTGYRRIGTNS